MAKVVIDKRMGILLGCQLITAIVIIVCIFVFTGRDVNNNDDFEFLRQTGNRLQASGVLSEAAARYEDYLGSQNVEIGVRAKLAFSLGGMYQELGQYEKALSWFYQVGILRPDSKYKSDADRQIVAILERLKKYSAAKYALSETTSLERPENVKKGGVVVAMVDQRPVYLHQIIEEIDGLPKEMKKQFSSAEGKKGFLQKYVADQLFAIKARKLQYHNEPKLRKQLEQFEKHLLVQRIIEEEINEKIVISESDVKNFFEANKKRYIKKKGDKPVYKQVAKVVARDYKMEKTREHYQRLVGDILKTEKVTLYMEKIK